MEEMIGYCGYRCHLCAARSDDPDVRRRLVDAWRRFFGHENYTEENVRCDGCRSEGRVADKECKARPCARERGVESCTECDDFPCDKMKHLMGTRAGMLLWCFPRTGSLTKEEYDLCMRQFDSMGELTRLMAERGRLPAWVLEDDD